MASAMASLSGLSNELAARQVQALKLCFSQEILNIVENLGHSTNQQRNQAQALKCHVDGRISKTIERRNLENKLYVKHSMIN